MNAIKTMLCCTAIAAMTAAVAVPSHAQTVTDDDKKFLATAAQSDTNEIALGKLAEQKAMNPAVKAFAKKMVTEHTMMTTSMKPFATAWGLNPPVGPDSDAKQEWDKLNKLSGKDFDKEYIDHMVDDHATALDKFQAEAKNTKDAKFRAAVLKGKTMVAAHKNMAYDLKKKM